MLFSCFLELLGCWLRDDFCEEEDMYDEDEV